MKFCFALFAASALLLPVRALADSTVVFNEVMYHPNATNEAQLEWVELHNQMAVDMDLSGWSLTGGVQFTFAEGTVIGGGKYLLVASSPTMLTAATGATNVLGPFTGRLGNAGDTLNLRNNNQRLRTTLDGAVVAEQDVTPVGGTAPYHTTSIQFTATGSSVTLALTQTATGDNTVLIDNVRIIVPPPPKLQIQLEAGGTVRLSWPVSASGNTLQSASVVTGAYSNTGLPVTVEVDENVSHDAVAPRNKFYGLVRWDEADVIHCWHCPASV